MCLQSKSAQNSPKETSSLQDPCPASFTDAMNASAKTLNEKNEYSSQTSQILSMVNFNNAQQSRCKQKLENLSEHQANLFLKLVQNPGLAQILTNQLEAASSSGGTQTEPSSTVDSETSSQDNNCVAAAPATSKQASSVKFQAHEYSQLTTKSCVNTQSATSFSKSMTRNEGSSIISPTTSTLDANDMQPAGFTSALFISPPRLSSQCDDNRNSPEDDNSAEKVFIQAFCVGNEESGKTEHKENLSKSLTKRNPAEKADECSIFVEHSGVLQDCDLKEDKFETSRTAHQSKVNAFDYPSYISGTEALISKKQGALFIEQNASQDQICNQGAKNTGVNPIAATKKIPAQTNEHPQQTYLKDSLELTEGQKRQYVQSTSIEQDLLQIIEDEAIQVS